MTVIALCAIDPCELKGVVRYCLRVYGINRQRGSAGSATLAGQQEPHTAITIDPKLLDAYADFYRNPASLMVVTCDGDHLLTRRAGNPPAPEYAYIGRDLFLTSAPQKNTLVTDALGRVIRVVHHQIGLHEVLERISAEDGERELAASS